MDGAAARDEARPLIRLKRVVKSYAETCVLNGIDLAIGHNEFFTLLGPSGCGKTTLLRVVAGFVQPSSGEVEIAGRSMLGLHARHRPVNTVFQNYALFPHMTVAENVAFGLEMLGGERSGRARRVEEMLALVRMSEFAGRRPSQLSGGQQQRVALARGLAPAPKVLLLDEPLSALDVKLRKDMQTELKRLQQMTGVAFVLVTHDQEEALALSDRIAVMDQGRIRQVGTPLALYETPVDRFVATFVGEANLLPSCLDPRAMIAVRPERIELLPPEEALVKGVVRSSRYLGSDWLVELQTTDGEVRVRWRGRAQPSSGETLGLRWPADAEMRLD